MFYRRLFLTKGKNISELEPSLFNKGAKKSFSYLLFPSPRLFLTKGKNISELEPSLFNKGAKKSLPSFLFPQTLPNKRQEHLRARTLALQQGRQEERLLALQRGAQAGGDGRHRGAGL